MSNKEIHIFGDKISLILEIIKLIILFVVTVYLTFYFLDKYLTIYNTNIITLDKYIDVNQEIEKKGIIVETEIEENKQKSKKEIPLSNFSTIKFNDQTFYLSANKDSFNYGFITKKIVNNKLYLYSHNSYRYSENSGKFFYNHAKLHDVVTFNDNIHYEIIKTEIVDMDNIVSINFPNGSDITYFTCTPYGDNLRKVFYFKKI